MQFINANSAIKKNNPAFLILETVFFILLSKKYKYT